MRVAALLLVLGLSGCQWVNANGGRFSCADAGDCGAGFECRAQFAGGGRCFVAGECVEQETCDGADENCDGRIDERFPEENDACDTGLLGVCATGRRSCSAGTLGCAQTVQPSAESCNGLDDDCDGNVDQSFDFQADEAHCGACNRACDAGTVCLAGRCDEGECEDFFDNDQDGLSDCDDPACLGQVCFSLVAPSWKCGALDPDAGLDAGMRDAGAVDAGTADAGAPDAGAPDAGSSDGGADGGGFILGCYPPEANCANGLDDDGDGAADCLDLDCAGLTCASGTVCTNSSCPGPG